MPNPNPAPPADPQVLARFQEELARTAALPGLAAASPALLPRFAGYYQGLARLPRRLRRTLQRRWRRSLGGIALLCALGQAPALAATIAVDGTICTLIEAITAAKSDAPAGGCVGSSGADEIVLSASGTHTLTAVNNLTYGPTGLPVITSAITVQGNSSTIARDGDAPPFRILAVGATGNLTLQDTKVSGGEATGNGGGVNNAGTMYLIVGTISSNTAGALGGGIANTGMLTVTDSGIEGNTARDASSGIQNDGTLTLDRSTVSGNTVQYGGGGGIGNAATMMVTNSTISGNSVSSHGGGISNFDVLALTNSTVSGNTAGDQGGGVYNTGTLTLTNSTVTGNRSGRVAGGITISGP